MEWFAITRGYRYKGGVIYSYTVIMTLFIISLVSGMLTVLAPCILPILPVVLGTTLAGRSRLTPYIVIGSLSISIILFTFLLKASTAFIDVPLSFWSMLSGVILVLFGVTLVFPALWARVLGVARLGATSESLLKSGHTKHTIFGDVLVGAALGPIFSTCSPTYFVILATVLPLNFFLGTFYLIAYVLGLALMLLLIAYAGSRLIPRLGALANPNGWFKRLLGILFVLLGLTIALGLEKKLEVRILESGYFDVTKIEHMLLQSQVVEEGEAKTSNDEIEVSAPIPDSSSEDESVIDVSENVSGQETLPMKTPTPIEAVTVPIEEETKKPSVREAPVLAREGIPYVELVSPSGFVNTDDEAITIGQFVGSRVILLQVMTYACINCKRTMPYVVSWYETYKDDGLMVIGIHTPEFAFEKKKENVETAMEAFGVTFPVVLDNEYKTWRALENRYWPRRYLIDIHGTIVYDHIGEGAYEETESMIKTLLEERKTLLDSE